MRELREDLEPQGVQGLIEEAGILDRARARGERGPDPESAGTPPANGPEEGRGQA